MESEGFMAIPKEPSMYVRNTWTCHDFVAVGFGEDECVAVGPGKEPTDFVRTADAKYGLGEVCWVLSMLLEHDNDVAGGIHRLHLRPIQLHGRDHCSGPPHSRNSPFHDRLSHIERRNRGDGKLAVQELVRAFAWLAHGTRPDIAFAPSALACFGYNPVGRGQTGFPLPHGNEGVALHPWRSLSVRMPTGGATATLDQWERISSDLRWCRQLETQETVPRRAPVHGSGVYGALPIVEGIGMDDWFPSQPRRLTGRTDGGPRRHSGEYRCCEKPSNS